MVLIASEKPASYLTYAMFLLGCRSEPASTKEQQLMATPTTAPVAASAAIPSPPPAPRPSPGPTATPKEPTEVMKFVSWASANRDKATKAVSGPNCKPDGWCSGFCNSFKSTEAFCSVRYWKADPRAVSFDIGMVPGPLTCTDLAADAQQRGRNAQDVGCILPSGQIGMINLRGGKMNSVFVSTPEYLEHDTDMVVP